MKTQNRPLSLERVIKGYKISIDLEKGGSGLNNIHLKVNNVKYFNKTENLFQAQVDVYQNLCEIIEQ